MQINPNITNIQKQQTHTCELCDFTCSKKCDYDRHIITRKHYLRTIANKNAILNAIKKYTCVCGKIYKHMSSLCKHKLYCLNKIEIIPIPHMVTFDFVGDNKIFKCICGKIYKHMSSLCNHKKICLILNKSTPTQTQTPTSVLSIETKDSSNNIIMELLKQNQEFKELIIEQNKHILEMASKIGTTSNNITHNNTTNFNLHFFLNEKCKDALNIEDFVSQIKLKISDLDMIGKVGYVEGITKIFLKNLKLLDICKRPIHCSDLKRETLYVKDKDAWEKENNENVKIKKAIKKIEDKNIDQLPQWMNENPAYNDYDSSKHMEYHHILIESMGGSSNDDDKKHNKIVRNIVKEIVIDKT